MIKMSRLCIIPDLRVFVDGWPLMKVVFVFLTVLFLFLFPTVATADSRQEYENIALGKSYPDSGNIDFADFGFIVEKWLGSGVPDTGV
jgi:hypothetical protein